MAVGGTWRRNVWARHAAVACGYALGYLLLRQVSWSHWVLFAGFRLAVLMLVPYRYWPALVVGELAPVGYTSLSCIDKFGVAWSAVMIVPPIALAMPVVKFCKDRLGMVPAHGPVRMSVVLGCAMAASALWTAANAAALAAAIVPAGTPPYDYSVQGSRWLLGNFLGVLTLVPLVLMVRSLWPRRAMTWGLTLLRIVQSRLLLETIIFLVPLLGLLVWIGLDASAGSRQLAQMLMFLPVIGLALRHGWHGAAVGATAASVMVALTMPARYDATTLQAELFLAFAASTMLLFGSQISVLSYKGSQRLLRADKALDLARRIHGQHEARLRRTSRAIEAINDEVHATQQWVFDRFGPLSSAADAQELRRRTNAARHMLVDLADGLQPPTLQRHGLVSTLRHGGLARALDSYGITYRCRGYGKIGELPKPMQLDIHRLVCEVVSHLCGSHSVGELSVRIRGGLLRGRLRAVIRIDAYFSGDPDLQVWGGHLLSRLAVTGLGMDAIHDRAALYEGTVRLHGVSHGERVSIMLHEPQDHAVGQVASVSDATAASISWR